MSKSKPLLSTAKAYLCIGLPGGPSLQGRWYLSAEPWDLSDSTSQQPLDGCTTPALPRHPVHLGQAHKLLRNAGQPEGWSGWTGKTPPAVKRVALGGEVGNTVQQDARFARKFLVLTHKTQYSCTFLLHLRKQCWCQGTSSDPNRVMSKGRMLMRAEMQ